MLLLRSQLGKVDNVRALSSAHVPRCFPFLARELGTVLVRPGDPHWPKDISDLNPTRENGTMIQASGAVVRWH